MSETKNESPPVLTRRSFIKRATLAVGAGVGASILNSIPITTLEAQPLEPAEKLRTEIEAKYGIYVRGIKEAYEQFGKKYEPNSNFPGLPLEWDLKRLEMLDQYLGLLPTHFLAPDQKDNKLMILLGKYSTVGQFSSLSEYLHIVELAYNRFAVGKEERSFKDLTHELIHIIDPVKDTIVIERTPEGQTYERLKQVSAWYIPVEQTLGQYEEFAPPVWEEVKKKQSYIFEPQIGWVRDPGMEVEMTPEQEEIDEFAIHFGYTLRHRDYAEFVAVLGENYIRGKDYFVRNYGNYLGEEKAEKLYEITKKEIFQDLQIVFEPPVEQHP